MDWLIDPSADREVAERALDLVDGHLRRHAADPRQVDDVAAGLRGDLDAAVAAADGSPLLLHVDWTEPTPVLTASRVKREALDADVPTGTAVPARLRSRVRSWPSTEVTRCPLQIVRRSHRTFEAGPPPVLDTLVDPARQGPAAVAVALVAAIEAHPSASAPQAASIAGSLIATAGAGKQPPADAAAAAESFVSLHQALGSEAYVVSVDDDVLELAVARCPFSSTEAGAGALCHVSTGLAGQLAARVHGEATVVLDETIVAGDPECHLQVRLGTPSESRSDAQTYFWPLRAAPAPETVPNLDLSVSLPRESVSVPVVRRLAAQALRAFGVNGDDVDDVQLAITEACANVIDHAGATDTYDVKIELSADRCAITVVDQGGGFDATSVPDRPHDDSEEGRGLALMRALVDNVAFRNEPQAGAVVHMVKSLRYEPDHPLRRG